jgi:hypothetical protein
VLAGRLVGRAPAAAVGGLLDQVGDRGATRDVDLVVEDLELPARARVVEPGRGQEARVSGS